MDEEETLIELSAITGWVGEPITDVVVYPSSESFTFKGWNREIPERFPPENMFFYPIMGNNSSIIFKAYPGVFPNGNSDFTYYGEIGSPFNETPPTPTRTGYTFNAWNSSFPSAFPQDSLEIQALWNPNNYEITFNYNGGSNNGSTSSISSVTYDAAYPNAPSITTKPKYRISFITANSGSIAAQMRDFDRTFTGYKDSSGTLYYDSNRTKQKSKYTIAGNLTVLAQWGKTEAIGNLTSYYNPTQTGYVLNGWYTTSARTTKVNNYPSGISTNISVYAKWDPNEYNLTGNWSVSGEHTTGTKDYNESKTIKITTTDMKDVPEHLILKKIYLKIRTKTSNSKTTTTTASFDSKSASVTVGSAGKELTENKTLSEFPNTHKKTSNINISVSFYLKRGNDHHTGNYTVTVTKLEFGLP